MIRSALLEIALVAMLVGLIAGEAMATVAFAFKVHAAASKRMKSRRITR